MVEGKPHYHVFLSHNSLDKAAVEPIAVMLREKSLNPFLDKWNLVPGEPIEDALIEALENSDSAVIFVGPGGDGPWQSEEMRDILKRAVKSHNEFRAIPVLLPNASAEALEKSFLGNRLWIEFKDVDDDDALLRLVKAIKGEAYADESFKLPDEPAPYRGLERFERIEKPEEDFFFGRDDEIRALVERLVKDSFVAVVGASGSGKSSLIRAGLTKQLAEDLQPGIRRWQTITVEPGSAPFRALAVQIAVAAGIGVAEREDWIEKSVPKWRASADGVRQSLETLFADAREPLLVFIDQFEELFTHGKKNEEHERIARNFVANLVDLWRNGGDRLRIVVAMRADFIDRCLEIGALKELLQDRTMLIGEVGDDALREIVKEPAAQVGAFLEKGLMERILTDVHNQSGSLPLLEQALHELWRQRRGAWLTHDAYDASGGVAGALNDQAQGAYKSLDDAQKKIADGLFPRLITLGEGVADTRRRVRRNELYPQGVEPSAVNAVIDKLSGKDARVLVTTREGGTAQDLGSGEDFVEFTHEALLGNWDHLIRLLDSERESIRKHRSLTSAAEVWESKPEDERQNFLLHHGQLEITERWATDEGGYARLNQLEQRFLDESIQERIAEEARKAKDVRRLRRRSWIATAAAVIALVGVGFTNIAYTNAQKSEKEAKENLVSANIAQALSAEKDGDWYGTLFALLAAYDAAPDGDRRRDSALRLIGAYAPGDFGTALKPEKSFRNFEEAISWPDFNPDGERVMISSNHSDKPSKPLPDQMKSLNFRAESPDGKTVAISGESSYNLELWDLETQSRVALNDVYVNSAAFSRDGTRIVTASNKTPRLWTWNAKSRELKLHKVLKGNLPHKDVTITAAYSPDGRRVVTTSQDGTARTWDAESGTLVAVLKVYPEDVPGGWVRAAAFSPDGGRIIAGGRVWDTETGEMIALLTENEYAVLDVAFSPDGRRVASGNQIWLLRPAACKDADWLRLSIEIRTGHAWDEGINLPYPLSDEEVKRRQARLDDEHGGKPCDVRVWDDLTTEETQALRGPGEK